MMMIHPVSAKDDDSKKQYMITKVTGVYQMTVEQSNKMEVKVIQFNQDHPKDTNEPASDVKVSAVFQKDQQAKPFQLQQTDDGLYQGDVTLPESGEWKMVVVTTMDGESVATHNETITVEDDSNSMMWFIGLGVGVVLLVILLLIFRRRKQQES